MVKYRTSLKQKIIFAGVCLLCGSTLTACSQRADKNGSMIAEDGRSYGGIIQAQTGEELNTAFFDVTVTDAVCYDTYQFDDGLYQAEEGDTYLVVTLTLKNTYDADLPMSITDFVLDYDGNSSEDVITGYGKADLNQDQFMENIFTLKQGETITKSILYTVKSKENYTLNYTEYYADEFKGDSYVIQLHPQNISGEADGQEEENTEAASSESGE